MIDTAAETLLGAAQALRHPALARNGRPAHIATLHRLFTKGARASDGTRVRLEFIRCPSGRRTSVEAIQRFCERLTAGAGMATASSTAAHRRQETRVDAELDALGIK